MQYLDLVTSAARRAPARTAVVGDGRRLSFADLDDRVDRLGAALRARGLRPGARVALLAANELECVEVQAACLRAGYALVPLNVRLADPELEFLLADSEPGLLVAGRSEADRGARLAAAGALPVVGLGAPAAMEPYDAMLAAAVPDPDADPLDPALPTTILYTSGTTGRPKGAVIDRRGMTARVFVNATELEVTPDDVFLQSLPMFHIAAFLAYAFVFRGASAVMLPQFDPARCLAALQDERVTATVLVPTMLQMVLGAAEADGVRMPRLRLMIYGGQPIEPPVLRRALSTFDCGFHQQYGMTETGAQTILRPGDHDPRDSEALASAGAEAASFDVRVVGPDDRPLPQGEVGEVVCRGPAVMSGYWNRPEATAETLRGGWMHTGDLGYRDGRGFLHIVDRRNDMIISGGENVYPREVEAALGEHPGVGEAAVLGLPDPTWGEVVTCVLVGPAPTDQDLAAFLRARLAGYKVPRRWVRMEALPRTAADKVRKGELRATLLGMLPAGAGTGGAGTQAARPAVSPAIQPDTTAGPRVPPAPG